MVVDNTDKKWRGYREEEDREEDETKDGICSCICVLCGPYNGVVYNVSCITYVVISYAISTCGKKLVALVKVWL